MKVNLSMSDLWKRCLEHLGNTLSADDLDTWLMPLQAHEDDTILKLYAPNTYTLDTVRKHYLPRIETVVGQISSTPRMVRLDVGSHATSRRVKPPHASNPTSVSNVVRATNLDSNYTFENFVEGKSNQLGKAAAIQIAKNPGKDYNPFLLYGSTGLGKTHLMHAVGNQIQKSNPHSTVLFLRAEQFVSGMIEALRTKSMDEFKRQFRSVDALLIDDIQFFAGKNTTQEEFFHTFNALFDSKQQIILTCDRYPKEVNNLEPRLKSRLGWGLSVAIEPPDFETRAAILLSKAQKKGVDILPEDVAMLLAKRIRSNVRDLEGALNTLIARAHFYGKPITRDFAEETLRDLLATHAQAVTILNIQQVTANYFTVRLKDLLSESRVRSLVRPRQIAMALAKELTDHSMPEIGEAFGGRDHTTVLHACRTIRKLCETNASMRQDWDKLLHTLTG